MKQERAAFRQSVGLTLWFCGIYERSTIILVEIFSDMCCLEDNETVRQTQWPDPFNGDRRCDRWLREEDMLKNSKKVGNFHFLCLVRATRIYIAVEEKLLGFFW